MAKKSNTQISAEINEILSRTAEDSIKPSDLRAILTNIKDSYTSLTNHIDLFGLQAHKSNRSVPYQLGESVLKDGVLQISKGVNSGAFQASNWLGLNKPNLLFELPEINSTQSYPAGTIMQSEFRAFKKLNTGIASDPYDVYEYTLVNTPMGYYGEPWQSNTIYKAGMVVEATVDGRKVYLKNTSTNAMLSGANSAALKAEWNAGKWSFVSESEPSASVLMTESRTMLPSDIGRKFYCAELDVNVSLPETLNAGWYASFFSIATKFVRFGGTGKILSVEDYKDVTAKGSAFVHAVKDGEFNITGNLN